MDTANRPKIKPPRPDSRPAATPKGRWLAACGAILLTGACYFCADWGLANLVAANATAMQLDLQTRATRSVGTIEAREVQAVGDALHHAQRVDPFNPNTAEQLGSHYALSVRDADAAGNVVSHWAKARQHYASAVVLRPTSPYSWANLAWTKFHLKQIDAEFYRALDSAIRLGPWEPEVQFVVVDLGFALWDQLPAEMRPRILAIAQNGQRRYATQIVAIAKQRGRLAEVCTFERLATMPVCKAISG